MSIIDTLINIGVIGIVILVGIGIFYKALQGPIDFIFGKIADMFSAMSGSGDNSPKYSEIKYN